MLLAECETGPCEVPSLPFLNNWKKFLALPVLIFSFGAGLLFWMTAPAEGGNPDRPHGVELHAATLPLACGSLESTPKLPRSASALCRGRNGNGASAEVRPLPRFSGGNASPGDREGSPAPRRSFVAEIARNTDAPQTGLPLTVILKHALPMRAGPWFLS